VHNKKELQGEETILNLPDVEDIPGQEHIKPPHLKEYSDITASSDDEEGKGLLDDEDNDAANVSPEEKQLLENSAEDYLTEDEAGLRKSRAG